jgi:predicted lipoprotein with Yx(FWY)xxD motif
VTGISLVDGADLPSTISHQRFPEWRNDMHRSRITITAIAVAVAAGGGVAYAATAGGSAGGSYGAAPNSYGSTQAPFAAPQGQASGKPTVHVATARVRGKTERILVDARGMPLYTYGHDTATTSRVTGQLATLWPPLLGTMPTERGTTASLRTQATGNGPQVTYQGHFLYTFVEDSPGQVTGQGVQDFFVAVPAPTGNE